MSELTNFTLREITSGSFLIAGLSAWLGSVWKSRIHLREKHITDIEIKNLEANHARKIQSLEHELQIERNAAQLGHAKLIETRAALIDQNYKLLVTLHEAIYDTIRPDYFGREKPSKQDAYNAALPKFDSFVAHFERNRIYFSRDIADKISSFYVAAAQTLDQARIAIASGESLGNGETPNLQKLFEKVNYDMNEARKSIEQDFRNILRVNEI
ncbi:hypothetical protein QN096_23475 [Metapseudomonas otitidis]|uniref:hypothetical protein n=1 Tax=Metapseudomonas otitidis TaxID=319939 RepID=UPI00253FFCFE|nr:hypothetical protein [Pseudomonas otitidis]WIF66695.1 hypothetical protein QN096_23475 [Pseudomonas otitidis]